jgi:hypothetical protein
VDPLPRGKDTSAPRLDTIGEGRLLYSGDISLNIMQMHLSPAILLPDL